MQLCSHSAVEWIHKSRRNPFIITAKWEPWRKNKPGLFICLPISPALVQLQQGINPLLQKQNTWNASVLYDFIVLPSYRLLNSKKKRLFFFLNNEGIKHIAKKENKVRLKYAFKLHYSTGLGPSVLHNKSLLLKKPAAEAVKFLLMHSLVSLCHIRK